MFWLLGLFCHNSVYLRERSEEKSHVMGVGGGGGGAKYKKYIREREK